jgi:integrase
MAVQKLTATFVREARAEPGKERSVYWDSSLPSFGLVVTKRGAKSWCVQYRNGQTSRRLSLNGVLTLDAARREARKLLGEVARGRDPMLERRKASTADRNSFKAIAERYLAREGGKLRSAARRKADLERLIYPALGNRQIDDIKRSDIIALLDDIEDERGAVMADQALKLIARICNWHAARSDEFRSPIVRGMARSKPQDRERDRVLADDELRAVWKAAENLGSPWSQYTRLLLLTAARRNEVARMTWGELSNGNWVIPPQRYKTGIEVTLPLSKAALKVLAEIPRIQDCQYVFTTNGRRPISAFSTLKLWLDLACGVKDWRIHDLRRTSRSLLSRAGVNPDIAERCLGHALPSVRSVYDKHKYVDEMRQAFEALSAQIAAIVGPQSKAVAL